MMINMFLYRVMSSGFSLCRWYKEILGISQSANFPLASAPKSNKEKKSLSFYSSIFSYSESLCAIIIWSVLFCFQSWPTCRYPDWRQVYAGTLQVSWPASGVCRYPAGILTSLRCMQVPCRYPDQPQVYAGTLQVSWPVSGVSRN